MLDRTPPYNLEAEQALLGSMLLSREAIAMCAETIKPEYFYKTAHKHIYSSIIELFDKGDPVDIVTLSEKLSTKNLLDEIGGPGYLADLVSNLLTPANVQYYAKLIEEAALFRKLIEVGTEIVEIGFSKENIEDALDRAERLVFEIAQKRSRKGFVRISDALTSTFEMIDKSFQKKSGITGEPSGFKDLDFLTAGFQPSDLIVIAARPSMGKTAFCLNLARYLSGQPGKAVGIFSLEMSKEQLAQRLICAESMIDIHNLRTGNIQDHEWPKLTRALSKLSECNLYIDDTPNISMLEMRAKSRKLKSETPLSLLIVDYLQLMQGKKSENRVQEVAEIARSLKALAREIEVPIIALSQLSRAVESRTEKRPVLSDLRESGEIEQIADVVAFIYRDEYYNPKSEKKRIAEIIIAKQRNGPLGKVELVFLKEQAKFVNKDDFYSSE
jgi:replicative DNA helicase|uniref:Replicative DNA helicase n=1 Tax=Thermodesulfobium narugense TaxID=184064 RepID=A0A7C5KE03_9BACT